MEGWYFGDVPDLEGSACPQLFIMTESNEEREKRVLRELEGKNVAYYQVLLSSWIETRMEQDKTIITISAAAVGLLVTIITTVGINGFWQYLFAIISIIGFIIVICSCIHIYQFNAKHLEESLRNAVGENTSRLLKKLDKLTIVSFYIGIACAVLMAVFVSFQKAGGLTMSDKKKSVPDKVEKLQKSVNESKKLSPENLEIGKSLNGIQNLSPESLQPPLPNSSQSSDKTQTGKENPDSKDKK